MTINHKYVSGSMVKLPKDPNYTCVTQIDWSIGLYQGNGTKKNNWWKITHT